MQITFASDYLPGYHKVWAGAEMACLRLAHLLIENKQQLDILTTQPDKTPEDNLRVYGIKTLGKGYFGRKLKGKMIRFLPVDPVAAAHSYRILRKIKPNVLHIHNFTYLSLSLISSAKKLNIPIVFSMYDFWSVCPNGILMSSNGQRCALLQGAHCDTCFQAKRLTSIVAKKLHLSQLGFATRRKITDRSFDKIDAFIVLSNTWKEILCQYGIDKERITVVPLPLFEEMPEQSTGQEENMLLFAGWVIPHKGLDVLIRAMPAVLKEVPEAKLHVIESGVDPDYKSKVLNLINQFGISNHIFFEGKKPNDQVQALLQKAEAVVVPEQWGIAWPIFLTEAMLCGKPIVASRIGDIPEFIKNTESGLLAEREEPSDFSNKIVWMLKNKQEAKEMGENAKIT